MANYLPRQTIIDGKWDNWGDTINLQNWLKAVGYYAKAREADGVWGYWTTLGIQSYLRTKYLPGYPATRVYAGALDGKFGPMTKKAMGDAAMYVLGQDYMMGYCGAGSCTIAWPHSAVVKSWQRFLNRNFKFAA